MHNLVPVSDRITKVLTRSGHLLNHDFCPWANRYVYWLKQPIGWFLVAAVASLLVGIFLAPQGLILFGAITVVIGLGVVWPWLSMRAGRATLSFDRHRCRAEDNVTLVLTVRNRWPVPLWGLSVEGGLGRPRDSSGGDLPVMSLASIPGWSETSFHFPYVPVRRGVYPQDTVRLSCGFPFGIWRSSRAIPVQGELIAWPRTIPLESVPSRHGQLPVVAGIHVDRAGDDGDVIGVRPYRPGDSLRNIHWAATARRDSFVVCERQQTAHQVVEVIIDAVPADDSGDDDEGVEALIRIGASIAQEFHAHHAHLHIGIGTKSVRVEAGPTGLKKMLDTLARYRSLDSPVSGLHSAGQMKHGCLSIVVTTPDRVERWRATHTRQGAGVVFALLTQEPDEASTAIQASGIAMRADLWMQIQTGQLEKQLRHQWEKVCHAAHCN
jgi:uncharacterized protein (DUF58 family)